jgi:hypothetical protein
MLLSGSLAAVTELCARSLLAQEAAGPPDPDCRRCRGLGVVPLSNAKPYVFVEGQGAFKPEEAAIGQPCPLCQVGGDKGALTDEAQRQHVSVLAEHAQWEERLGEKLLLVQTRHVAIHTELKPADAKRVGESVEEMTIRLQKAAGSLAITPTRPAGYPQVLLWGEPSWTKFRAVMERLYTPEQLGDDWRNAGKGILYDHAAVAHCYLTPKTVHEVPAEYFAVKLAAARQIWVASGMHAPPWLIEGFAGYAQHLVLGAARVYTIYALGRGPRKPVTLSDAARAAAAKQFRPWDKLLTRELRDLEAADYAQSPAMVAFLLEDQPSKFLSFVGLLQLGMACPAALEEAYGKSVADLEAASAKWLARR